MYLKGSPSIPNNQNLAVVLHAKGTKANDKSWRRESVLFKFKVPNFKDQAKTVCKSKTTHCYHFLSAAAASSFADFAMPTAPI